VEEPMKFITCASIFLFTIASAYGQQSKGDLLFAITISAPPPPIKVGAPILIHIVLKSTSDKQITVPETRHGGTQGEFNYRISVKSTRGPGPEDTEHGRKRKNHTEVGSFSVILKYLNQGDEIAEDADLNNIVKITEPGDYEVQVERDDETYAPLHIKSNTLVIHVTQ
jgi:hypothetical protein